MKKIFKKSILFVMTGVMLLGSIVPTFAAVNEKQTVSANNNAQTEVIYNQESTFGVTVPKKIDLGSDKTTDYTVTVFGDIASDETIFVVPDESFLMKDTNTSNPKADVEALVNQDKTEWKFNDLSTIGNGNILAEDLTAGIWEGKFYFNIKLKNCNISVTATNEAGEDINASATYITGEEKDNLLNSLVEEGFVEDVSDVDALINVKSDDFDGLADTTFDVSDIASEGEQVVILHFDEEKQEWEYIGTETVDKNGLISGDFTSYSPVAFVKVTENGEYEKIAKTFVISWSQPIAKNGTYLGDSEINKTKPGSNGKRIIYTNPKGELCYASPYIANSIEIKEGTKIIFEMHRANYYNYYNLYFAETWGGTFPTSDKYNYYKDDYLLVAYIVPYENTTLTMVIDQVGNNSNYNWVLNSSSPLY